MTITKYKENKYRGADNSFSAPAYFKCHTVENTISIFYNFNRHTQFPTTKFPSCFYF